MSRGPVEHVIRDTPVGSLAPEVRQRLMATETQEILTRLKNLDGFLQTKTYAELPALDQRLLLDQRREMEAYARTLCLRYCMALLTG